MVSTNILLTECKFVWQVEGSRAVFTFGTNKELSEEEAINFALENSTLMYDWERSCLQATIISNGHATTIHRNGKEQ